MLWVGKIKQLRLRHCVRHFNYLARSSITCVLERKRNGEGATSQEREHGASFTDARAPQRAALADATCRCHRLGDQSGVQCAPRSAVLDRLSTYSRQPSRWLVFCSQQKNIFSRNTLANDTVITYQLS